MHEKTIKFAKSLKKILSPNKKDEMAIDILVNTYNTYVISTENLTEKGYTYKVIDRNGLEVERANPFVKIQLDAQIQLTKLMIEFGLTPKSRMKLLDDSESEESPLEKMFKGIEKR